MGCGASVSGARAAGVSWFSRDKKWKAAIRVDAGEGGSQLRHLGWFVNEVDAALAYDQAAREYLGNKAQLNFPDLPPQPQMASRRPTRQASSQYRGKGGRAYDVGYLASDDAPSSLDARGI
jgi:hypothetical protein